MAVYFSVVRFFGLESHFARMVVIYALSFLSISFFLSTAIAHIRDNAFSRAYYFISGVWMGILVNLVVFFCFAWLIIFLNERFHFLNRIFGLGLMAVFLATFYSIYGIWNAFNPIVKRLDVSINNLPKKWIGKKIVQISDVHLGHVFREKWMHLVVEKINKINPEIVLITGDLFDWTDGKLDSFVSPLNYIKAPDGIYFITGNHETYLGLNKAADVIKKTKIIWLRDAVKTINGLQFIGIDYPLHGKDRQITKIIPKIAGYNKSKPSILLIHEPIQIKKAKALGINLQLSGHTHKGQLFPFGIITRIFFGKYDYGFHRDGDYAEYTSSGLGLGGWGPPMRTEKSSEIVEITLH